LNIDHVFDVPSVSKNGFDKINLFHAKPQRMAKKEKWSAYELAPSPEKINHEIFQ
jgi:hypothetical protein